jgi:phosphatidylethanolamine-binding protein (PEBP) family uncharacterized protein
MRAVWNAATGVCLVAALVMSGCGSSDPISTASTASLRRIVLGSPAIAANGATIPARYTCDGADTSLPLRWSGVPRATKEILLMMFSIAPVGQERVTETPQWVVAGLAPNVHELAAGTLPAGALVGRDPLGQSRYSVCPAKGARGSYLLVVFASPQKLEHHAGFADTSAWARLSQIRPPYGDLFVNYSRT